MRMIDSFDKYALLEENEHKDKMKRNCERKISHDMMNYEIKVTRSEENAQGG